MTSAAALGFAVLALGCQSAPSGPSTGGEFYDLTSQQRMRLERRAAAGDRSAAVRLFEYYTIARRDAVQTERWRKRMRELEHR
jgi:hypothetical protein